MLSMPQFVKQADIKKWVKHTYFESEMVSGFMLWKYLHTKSDAIYAIQW